MSEDAAKTGKTYRIGEAAKLLHLETHVLRYWEEVFPQLAPPRTEKGQRLYTENDLRMLRRIQDLVHVRGITLGGARRILEGSAILDDSTPDGLATAVPDPQFMLMLRQELGKIRQLLTKRMREMQ